jgi:hypothetical protein
VSKCWKQEKPNWKCLGSSSQESAESGSTGLSGGSPDCPVVHRTVRWVIGLSGGAPDSVRCARLTRRELGALGNSPTAYGYNSPDCPVCTGLSGEPTVGRTNGRPRNPRATRGRANGRKGAPDCPVRQWLPDLQRSTGPFKERNRAPDSVRCAPDCPVRPMTEGKISLPELLSTAPSYLGAIKGTPRRMEEYTKHSYNIPKHQDIDLTHSFHCDSI